MSGLSTGLPLAKKIFLTAEGFSALAPKPYTVSVGNATKPPSKIMRAAISIL